VGPDRELPPVILKRSAMASTRTFSLKCIKCRQKAVELAPIAYHIEICHDGRKYDIDIPELVVPKCKNCGNFSLDDEANRIIDNAFRDQANLLTPENIREGRDKLGLNQQQIAEHLGIAVSTLSRWETGAQIQQRVMDRYLRAFFALPKLRDYLRHLTDKRTSDQEGVNAVDTVVS
jgi:putative zinc finger/helix-turn-helix YgiT family protein